MPVHQLSALNGMTRTQTLCIGLPGMEADQAIGFLAIEDYG